VESEGAGLGRGVRRALATALVAAAVAAVVLTLAGAPEVGEPLGLRWLRLASTHPIRCALAVMLGGLALVGPGDRSGRELAGGEAPAPVSIPGTPTPGSPRNSGSKLELGRRIPMMARLYPAPPLVASRKLSGDEAPGPETSARRTRSSFIETVAMLPALDELVRGPEKCGHLGQCLLIEPTCSTHKKNQFPSQAVVVTNAARRMIELSKAGEKLNSIVVHGDQDPASHPEFRAISENLRELTNKWFARSDLVLLSDSQNLDRTDVQIALALYDKPILRFEAGTQKTFKELTGARPTQFKEMVENLSRLELERMILQACFVRGAADNSTDSELKAWYKYVADFKPASVQIYTLPKATNDLKPVTKAKLEKIAAEVSDKVGIPCEICEV
jgi:hypothetical protein